MAEEGLAVAAGSRTQLHSLVVVACIIFVLLFLRPVLAVFPTAALGAIVITPRPGSSTWLSSAGSPGTGAASWCFPWSPCFRCWSSTSSRGSWSPSSSPAPRRCAGSPGRTMIPGLLVYRYDAPLYFANARDFRQRALAAADAHASGLHWFVLNIEANVDIDITAMDAVEEVRAKLVGRGVVFAFARVKRDIL